MTNEEAIKQLLDAEHCLAGHGDLWDVDMEAFEAAIKALKQQSCEDCISRKEVNVLVDELARAISDERRFISRGRSTAAILQDILDLPSVTPQPKTGEWILLDECSNSGYYCSKCHKKVIKEGWSNTVKKVKYCPNCGAKMQKVRKKNDIQIYL